MCCCGGRAGPSTTSARDVYDREEGLHLRRKTPKRKVSAKRREDRVAATAANDCWSMDFLSDQLFDGRKIRVLTIVDNFTRVSPAIDVRTSYRGADVVATLDRVASTYGRPKRIRVDNGPEFISKDLDLWAWLHGVELDFSRPGQADRRRLCGVVQWQVPGRVPERLLVPQPGRCQAEV